MFFESNDEYRVQVRINMKASLTYSNAKANSENIFRARSVGSSN